MKYLKLILKCSTWVNVLALCICLLHCFPLYLQHTASTVFAATHPAPCLLTFHRRGWCQLHQPQWEPWFQPAAQTHAPFLPGNGLWPVSFIHSPTWLFTKETYNSFFLQQMDWYHQRMCVFCLSTRRTGGEETEEGAVFQSSYLFTPASLENWNPQSGRGGRRHWMTLTNSHDSQQCPLVHLLLLPRRIHIFSQTNTNIYKYTHA